jgi:Transcriptional regulator, AbiEi antitoxin
MPGDFRHLADTATGQHGAITASQIVAAGITSSGLRRRVQSGVLVRIGSHTYRSPFAAKSALDDLAALVLDCGVSTFASGPSAAALHGFDGFRLKSPFHVTVVRGRNVQRAHHHIHTTLTLPLIDRATVNEIPAMSATRTLIDIARFVTASQLTTALDSALRDGLTSEDVLHRRIVALRSSGRYGIPKLLAVIEGSEITRGAHSWLERRFLRLCQEAGLPPPHTQQILSRAEDRIVRVDCRFPGTPVVVELLGYRWHRTKDQLARDVARMNALILDGFAPMQFTYVQVTAESAWVIDQVRSALHTFG